MADPNVFIWPFKINTSVGVDTLPVTLKILTSEICRLAEGNVWLHTAVAKSK